MIPAPPGLVALYKHNDPPHHTDIPVIAFDEGRPLVIDRDGKHDKTRLIRADSYSNYDGMAQNPYPGITALLPAGGWRVEFTDPDGSKWSEPLVGWGLRDGSVVPLTTDSTGYVNDFDPLSQEYRIYHPDATQAATKEGTTA
jgi:hypothetical protein